VTIEGDYARCLPPGRAVPARNDRCRLRRATAKTPLREPGPRARNHCQSGGRTEFVPARHIRPDSRASRPTNGRRDSTAGRWARLLSVICSPASRSSARGGPVACAASAGIRIRVLRSSPQPPEIGGRGGTKLLMRVAWLDQVHRQPRFRGSHWAGPRRRAADASPEPEGGAVRPRMCPVR
jgi:hypothetical protein